MYLLGSEVLLEHPSTCAGWQAQSEELTSQVYHVDPSPKQFSQLWQVSLVHLFSSRDVTLRFALILVVILWKLLIQKFQSWILHAPSVFEKLRVIMSSMMGCKWWHRFPLVRGPVVLHVQHSSHFSRIFGGKASDEKLPNVQFVGFKQRKY